MDNSDLAKRMKGYEEVSKSQLMKRTPVILRLDGKTFHTFTRGFQKSFDGGMIMSAEEQRCIKHSCNGF